MFRGLVAFYGYFLFVIICILVLKKSVSTFCIRNRFYFILTLSAADEINYYLLIFC